LRQRSVRELEDISRVINRLQWLGDRRDVAP
jgi:hypothetical protein